jgi:hypothetical protein
MYVMYHALFDHANSLSDTLGNFLMHFSTEKIDVDWSCLRVAVDIVDYFTRQLDVFFSKPQPLADLDQSWHGDDGILVSAEIPQNDLSLTTPLPQLLDRKLAAPLFSLTRGTIQRDHRISAPGIASERTACSELVVLVAGRVGAQLLRARLTVSSLKYSWCTCVLTMQRLSQHFSSGKYCVFDASPSDTTLLSRKFLVLFATALVENGVTDFKVRSNALESSNQLTIVKDLGTTVHELFLSALVKPCQFLAYENRFAQALKRKDDPYLRDAFVDVGKHPDYNTNRDLFECKQSRPVNHDIAKTTSRCYFTNAESNAVCRTEPKGSVEETAHEGSEVYNGPNEGGSQAHGA